MMADAVHDPWAQVDAWLDCGKLMQGLKPRHREVAVMRLEGQTYREVASELGVSTERARQVFMDAERAMRQQLDRIDRTIADQSDWVERKAKRKAVQAKREAKADSWRGRGIEAILSGTQRWQHDPRGRRGDWGLAILTADGWMLGKSDASAVWLVDVADPTRKTVTITHAGQRWQGLTWLEFEPPKETTT